MENPRGQYKAAVCAVGVAVSAKLNPSTNRNGPLLTFTDQFLKLDFCDWISLSHTA